jgi:peptidyl-dipeptidase A
MNTENGFLNFVENYEKEIAPLTAEYNRTYFDASITGKEEHYRKAEELHLKITKYYSDREKFKYLKKLKETNPFKDQILKRILTLLFNSFAEHQYRQELLEKIVQISNKLEQDYSTFRASLDGKNITDNEIDDVLNSSKDSEEVKKYWLASKQIGKEVFTEVIELAKLRNQAAQELEFNNYFEMSLQLSELNVNFLTELLDRLDSETLPRFKKLKNQIDSNLSEKFSIATDELMPWHYGDRFFQSGPKLFDVDFDSFYKEQNIENLTKKYYDSINLDISDILKKSDLYERVGKYQHAYCTNIDREGDVRVLCNIKPNHRWMSTMLHEFGHAVYDKYISQKLPWTLREPAHIFTTEAIAMLFGRMASSTDFIENLTGANIKDKEKFNEEAFKSLQAEQLIFSRWVQVVFRFEKAMYENPDGDLNSLWKNLVSKYQLLNYPSGRNEPDWAAKIHIALYPAYYQNYILGELLASQLYFYLKDKVLKTHNSFTSFYGAKDVGEYLKNLFFSYGSLYRWDELIEKATGEKLNPKYYIKQFVKE